MCEKLLNETLSGNIPLNLVLEYLTNPNSEKRLLDGDCLQVEFASYVLNYIHEIQHINKNKSTICTSDTTLKTSPHLVNQVTPKYNRKRALFMSTTPKSTNKNINDSYLSPVSPLYVYNKSPARLCLGDFTINTPKCSTQKKTARRINPTSLNFSTSPSQFSNNSFSFCGVTDNTDGQRKDLAEECLKIVSTRKSSVSDLTLKSLSISNRSEITPCLEKVTFKEQLNKLILIYNHILSHNYVLNLLSELHFIVTVLLTKEYDNNDEDVSLLHSLHNRVYFAANVLCSFNFVLGLLDRLTLRLFLENKRILNFVKLNPVEIKCDIENVGSEVCNENVRFISDTDNRTNFPNDVSFHAFRKQRDLFYEILRIWEINHLYDEWNFGIALGGKIKALLNMHQDAANMVHLARLIKAQLLANTCGNNDEDLSFISSISNANADKLQRLQKRIISKQANQSLHASPTFNGYEEFYRDFITVGAHHVFNRHLNDAFICNIVELNNTRFDCVDLDDTESVVDTSTKKLYKACLKSLRVLAKFLGFLDCLPYMPQAQIQNVTNCFVEVRRSTQPNINLLTIVEQLCSFGNLILTVPWLTKYMAMLDSASLRLPYMEKILHRLFEIYCSNMKIPVHNMLFIKINLGWLFELHQFPEDLYYDWLKKCDVQGLEVTNSTLDNLDIIDHSIIYMCCPYLNEIKKLLSNDMNSIGATVKHITPLTSTQPSHKRLQFQLEEAFFTSQPISVRKTVEFVSERVASACVKYVCNELVPSFRKDALYEFRNMEENLPVIDKIAADQLKKLRKLIDSSVKTLIESRIVTAIDVLMANDMLIQTKQCCVHVTTQNCLERVQQWINSHVNIGLFIKDFEVEINRKLTGKPINPVFNNQAEHKEYTVNHRKCLEDIMSLSSKLLEDAEIVKAQTVDELVHLLYVSMYARGDLNEHIFLLTCKMLIDLILLLLAHRPDLLHNKIEQKILCVWHQSQEDLFHTFISPKNLAILSHSSNIKYTQEKFCMFVKTLLEENLLNNEDFQSQMHAVYKQDLHKGALQFLKDFSQHVSKKR